MMGLDVFPLTSQLDFAAKAAGCTVLSKIDLQKGHHQIPVNPEDMQKPPFTTPFGLFEYKRMPFCLRNARPSFQHHVNRVILNCKAAFAWVDDIIICSSNHEEHVVHMGDFQQTLHGLVIQVEKCVWGVPELGYLCHKILAAGMLPLPSWGWSTSRGYFCPSIALMLQSLTDKLHSGKKGPEKLEWSAAINAAIAADKQTPLSSTHLAHPTVGAELSVVVDSSATSVNACSCPARRTGSPWDQRSWVLPSRSNLLLTGSSSSATPA
jgi:hypothetical protein